MRTEPDAGQTAPSTTREKSSRNSQQVEINVTSAKMGTGAATTREATSELILLAAAASHERAVILAVLSEPVM